MRVNRGLLGWGVFFLALGGVPLAVDGGVLDTATARRAWELWPLLLVGAGLGLALRSTSLAAVGGVVVALTFGIMAGGVVAAGFGTLSPLTFCGVANDGPPVSGRPLTGALGANASVQLNVDCGTLTATAQPGSGWSIDWPTGAGSDPQVTQPSDARLRVEFSRQRTFAIGEPAARWTMLFPADPATSLVVSVNAGSARLALGSAHVTSLDASVNAGDAVIDLGEAVGTTSVTGSANAGSLTVTLPSPASTLTGTLSANVGSVRICAPAGVPLRIRVGDQPLGSTNFGDRGLSRSGDTWTRGVWSTATTGIDLVVSANLGSITLDPEDGCG